MKRKVKAPCSQCGKPLSARACGPTHAAEWARTRPTMKLKAAKVVRGIVGVDYRVRRGDGSDACRGFDAGVRVRIVPERRYRELLAAERRAKVMHEYVRLMFGHTVAGDATAARAMREADALAAKRPVVRK